MAALIWTEPALSDLNDIAEYIGLDNRPAAQNLLGKVLAATRQLEAFPQSGRRPPELVDSIYRELIVGPCRIFYRYNETRNEAYIVRIMRSERLLRNLILAGK